MIIKERFPEYNDIDELVSIVQEHHLPIDKGASICAATLKAADQKARREEIKRWFIKTYGKEAKSPDLIPFSTDALELNADDLIDRAKRHPLYLLISDLKMAKG
jgi:hypothetical protein